MNTETESIKSNYNDSEDDVHDVIVFSGANLPLSPSISDKGSTDEGDIESNISKS